MGLPMRSSKQFLMHVDVLDGNISFDKIGFIHDSSVQRDEMLNPGDDRLVKSRPHTTDCIITVMAPDQ